ncbi:MAG: bifunctional UDP-sugar hydrolase/5'-nucleotidase [Candidatus Bipolaricaulota bacterium]
MKPVPLTLLHSNDMHGDFLSEAGGKEGKLIGGLARLSGYVRRVRDEVDNVLYVISGDMLQGSIIDSEYRGISTIEIMNYLAPDVVSLGNHEFDYGLPHLLFLEKVASFPIVNANLYLRAYRRRLMKPYHISRAGGLDVLFIGIITDKILADLSRDAQVASFLSLEEASAEVGRITNAYKNDDIDLTVLLTHIGFESDLELAGLLKPEWGVDLIIGGHSHTVLEQPAEVNGVLIAQAGVGTDQIGRFDLVIDDDTNSVVQWSWKLVPIDEAIAEPDRELQAYVEAYKTAVDRKYAATLCTFAEPLRHPTRVEETPLGNLVADGLAEMTRADLVLVGSGSIRSAVLGSVVTLGDFAACFPFDEPLFRFVVAGRDLLRVFAHIMRPENRTGEGECYQVNRGMKAVYRDAEHRLVSLDVRGEPVRDDGLYSVVIPEYHTRNAKEFLGISREELEARGGSKVAATSIQDVLREFFGSHPRLTSRVEGRLTYT